MYVGKRGGRGSIPFLENVFQKAQDSFQVCVGIFLAGGGEQRSHLEIQNFCRMGQNCRKKVKKS